MKKILANGITLLSLVAATCHAQSVGIDVCMPINNIHVGPFSFQKKSPIDAIKKVFEKTGYTVIDKGLKSSDLVSAKELEGPLDAILDKFSESYNFESRTKGCAIYLYEKGKAPLNKSYYLSKGSLIKDEIIKWAKDEGWHLEWHPKITWEVFANTTIDAVEVKEAIGLVVEYLRAEGKPVKLNIFGNNVMEIQLTTIGFEN